MLTVPPDLLLCQSILLAVCVDWNVGLSLDLYKWEIDKLSSSAIALNVTK